LNIDFYVLDILGMSKDLDLLKEEQSAYFAIICPLKLLAYYSQ